MRLKIKIIKIHLYGSFPFYPPFFLSVTVRHLLPKFDNIQHINNLMRNRKKKIRSKFVYRNVPYWFKPKHLRYLGPLFDNRLNHNPHLQTWVIVWHVKLWTEWRTTVYHNTSLSGIYSTNMRNITETSVLGLLESHTCSTGIWNSFNNKV